MQIKISFILRQKATDHSQKGQFSFKLPVRISYFESQEFYDYSAKQVQMMQWTLRAPPSSKTLAICSENPPILTLSLKPLHFHVQQINNLLLVQTIICSNCKRSLDPESRLQCPLVFKKTKLCHTIKYEINTVILEDQSYNSQPPNLLLAAFPKPQLFLMVQFHFKNASNRPSQSHCYKSIDIKFEDGQLPTVLSLAQHPYTPSPVQEEALRPNSASKLDETLRCHCARPPVFGVYDSQGFLVTGPANHNGEICVEYELPGLELRQMTTSSMSALGQAWRVLKASPWSMLISLSFPSLAPSSTRLGCRTDAVREQIMVLFWMIRYKKSVQTTFPAPLTTCHTFRLSSKPQETSLLPEQFSSNAVTDVLLTGRLKRALPSLLRLQTLMVLSQLPEMRLRLSCRSRMEVTAARCPSMRMRMFQVAVSHRIIEEQPWSLPEAKYLLPLLTTKESLQMLALWPRRQATCFPLATSQMPICPSLLPMAIKFLPTSSEHRAMSSERLLTVCCGSSATPSAHSTAMLCCSCDTPTTLKSSSRETGAGLRKSQLLSGCSSQMPVSTGSSCCMVMLQGSRMNSNLRSCRVLRCTLSCVMMESVVRWNSLGWKKPFSQCVRTNSSCVSSLSGITFSRCSSAMQLSICDFLMSKLFFSRERMMLALAGALVSVGGTSLGPDWQRGMQVLVRRSMSSSISSFIFLIWTTSPFRVAYFSMQFLQTRSSSAMMEILRSSTLCIISFLRCSISLAALAFSRSIDFLKADRLRSSQRKS